MMHEGYIISPPSVTQADNYIRTLPSFKLVMISREELFCLASLPVCGVNVDRPANNDRTILRYLKLCIVFQVDSVTRSWFHDRHHALAKYPPVLALQLQIRRARGHILAVTPRQARKYMKRVPSSRKHRVAATPCKYESDRQLEGPRDWAGSLRKMTLLLKIARVLRVAFLGDTESETSHRSSR